MTGNTAEENKGFAENNSELDQKKKQDTNFKDKAKEVGKKAYKATLHTANGVGRVSMASARVIILSIIGVVVIETLGLGMLAGLGVVIATGATLIYGTHGLLTGEWKSLNAFA